MSWEWAQRLFGIPSTRQENERIIRIYESKQELERARDKYRLGIKNRRLNARQFAREGHRQLAKNELITIALYTQDLNMTADLLLNIERLIAARERGELLKTSSSVMKDVYTWMKKTVSSMNDEPVTDQSLEMDEMVKKLDRIQFTFTQSNDNAVKQSLGPTEMDVIEEELNDLCEYDDTDPTQRRSLC